MKRIALLGAPGTGKTALSRELGAYLCARGLQGSVLPEVFRPPFAGDDLRGHEAILLTGLDLPGSSQAQERSDAALRALLHEAGLAFQVVYGQEGQRLQCALRGLQAAGVLDAEVLQSPGERPRAWTWLCDKCSDPECEHRLFSQLQAARA